MSEPEQDAERFAESLELAARAQGGDQSAFSDLLERYYPRVLGLVRQKLGGGLRRELESVDVAQAAMVEVVRSFERFAGEDERALIRWMAGVVENRIRDLAKYHQADKRERGHEADVRRGAEQLGVATEEVLPSAGVSDPGERAAASELEGAFEERLASLSLNHQEVLRLHRSGLNWSSIAERMGLPSEAAARMLHGRATVALLGAARDLLGGDDSG